MARTPTLRVEEWLSNRLGMSYVYTRANGYERGIGFEEGLAVLSHFPLVNARRVDFRPPLHPLVRRIALGADVLTPGGRLPVFTVHLSVLPRQNAMQIRRLRGWVARTSGWRSAIVGGDFNVDEGAQQIVRTQAAWVDLFRYKHPHADGTTHSLRLPGGREVGRRRLDYLFLRPGDRSDWEVLDAGHIESSDHPHSDHRVSMARVRMC